MSLTICNIGESAMGWVQVILQIMKIEKNCQCLAVAASRMKWLHYSILNVPENKSSKVKLKSSGPVTESAL
jgi:hypothetical protein